MPIRPQRDEGTFDVPSGTTVTPIRETGHSEVDRVLSYALGTATQGTALITVTQRGKFGAERIVTVAVGPGGAGRLRVSGCVEVSVTGDAVVGTQVITLAMLAIGNVEPLPFVDHLDTRTGAAAAPGPWIDVGNGNGWPPPERYTVDLFTATGASIEFRFVDSAGNLFAQWTVNGRDLPINHPPRCRLQARNPTALTTSGFVAVWR